MGGRGGLLEESEEDNEVDIDELIEEGVMTDPVIEVEGTAHMLEEEEEVVVVGRAVKLEEVEDGEIEVELLERVGVESGAM